MLIAAGPQFGTVSLGGVLIAIVEILRAIANYVQDASAESDNILMARPRRAAPTSFPACFKARQHLALPTVASLR